MYVEFGEQLINSVYFGKVEKVDSDNDGTPVYSLQYELINGSKYVKDYSSETARDDDYDALKQEGSSGGGSLDIVHATTVSEEGSRYELSIEETASEILAMELPIFLLIDTGNTGSYFLSSGLKLSTDGTTELDFLLGSHTAAIVISDGEIQTAVFDVNGG